MSLSLSAVQADGYYQPPDFDHKRHGTINKIHGTHRLGARAKRIHEGIIIVRFEMPFKAWCLGCGTLIAQGVRFDADKQKIGKFHSSTIWQFSMKCHHCTEIYVIKTDPETSQYICVSGIRRKEEQYDPTKAEGHNFRSEEELLAIERDPLLKLEILQEDTLKARSETDRLEQLLEIATDRADDVALNKELRRRRREESRLETQKSSSVRLPEEEEAEIDREYNKMASRKRRMTSTAAGRLMREGVFSASLHEGARDSCKKSNAKALLSRRLAKQLLLRKGAKM